MKKGFTLVELLAVIIILSIIALITTPVIVEIINNADKKSLEITCKEIYKSYEQYEISEDIGKSDYCSVFEFFEKRETTEIIDGVKYVPISKLEIKGEIPKDGTFKICNDSKQLIIDNGKYTCIKDNDSIKIIDGTIRPNNLYDPIIKNVTLTSTTNSIKVFVETMEDKSVIKKYYYRINGQEFSSDSNTKTFDGLKNNEEYKIDVIVENINGFKSKTTKKTIKTKNIIPPIIKQTGQTIISGYNYAQLKTIQITYSNTNITSPVYYFKSSVGATVASGVVTASCGTGTNPGTCTNSNVTTLVANTWYKTTSTTPSIVYEKNGVLYTLTSDGKNISGTSTFTISKIDTSAPSASMSVGNIKTDRATITAICSDAESGITKYEYSKDNGTTWISNGTTNNYTFTGLTKETSYQYKIRCTNGSGLTKEASSTSSTLGFTNPTIKQISQTPSSGYSYAQSRTIQITYSSTNVTSPVYYFKSSVGATVASGVVTASCGTGTNPGTCTSSSVTTLVANTWYKTTSTTPSVIYKANGTLYALTSDGANISGTSTFTISKIDTSTPTTPTIKYNGGSNSHSWKNNYNITLTSTATSGIHHYEVDWDGDGVANYASSSNFIPWDGYSSCNNRFRAVSNSGVVSEWTDVQHIHMDTSAPGVTTITYNGGANTCTWKNNYNITLTASDNIGVSYYQIDTNNDGIADAQTASNFIPANGYHSHTVRFRAVDYAGNIGPWTENQHIHMDSENPVHTNWWWGEVTKDVARLYVQATDSVGLPNSATTYDGHNAGVYCPTSTQSGGYTNFVWFKGNWDASANAYRCDITPSTFGHYGQIYRTHLYIYDYAGNGGYYNATSVNIPSPSYAATNSSYQAVLNTTTYPAVDGSPYHCCWHISSANASKSQCSEAIVDYTDGSGRWECNECSDNCVNKECPNGGNLNGDICTKSEYTCPNGGTLSGTTCVLYTCPNGGTLSGTMCIR